MRPTGFAIGSHKKWKRREDLSSILPNIKGVGKKRMMLLLKEFPSLEAMREADADRIARLPGFNRKIAERDQERTPTTRRRCVKCEVAGTPSARTVFSALWRSRSD